MNSSSSFISSRGESSVNRLRIGTPSFARRSNLRRISYFSFMTCSSDILRSVAPKLPNGFAFMLSIPSELRTPPADSMFGIILGASSAPPNVGRSMVESSGRSMLTDSVTLVLVKKSAPNTSIYLLW